MDIKDRIERARLTIAEAKNKELSEKSKLENVEVDRIIASIPKLIDDCGTELNANFSIIVPESATSQQIDGVLKFRISDGPWERLTDMLESNGIKYQVLNRMRIDCSI